MTLLCPKCKTIVTAQDGTRIVVRCKKCDVVIIVAVDTVSES